MPVPPRSLHVLSSWRQNDRRATPSLLRLAPLAAVICAAVLCICRSSQLSDVQHTCLCVWFWCVLLSPCRIEKAQHSTSGCHPKQAKRQVSISTFNKWQLRHEKEHKTLSWLRCDKRQNHVETLWCETCRRFKDKIRGAKNFSTAWIAGFTNQKLSNVLDHGRSEQQKASMHMLRSEQAKATNAPLTAYAPITKSLLAMDKSLQGNMGKKFDICYVLAK